LYAFFDFLDLLDQIVEMCDELIAAHGNLLPPVDAKKTLVPNSGKTFPPVDPATLRKSSSRRARASPTRWWSAAPT